VAIEIRKVESSELGELQEIAITTFLQAFLATNDAEDMAKYVETRMSAAQLALELENPESDFFFAIDGGSVVGYLKVNVGAAQTESHENALEIERIYVLESFLGLSLGQQLFELAQSIALERGVDFIWLGVWAQNHRAIRFYEKNGFEVFGEHIFMLGDDAQMDLMMRKRLKP